MQALEHFYNDLGDKLWGPYGFYDAFSVKDNWYPQKYLAIDQGPIVIMIENSRSALIWNVFMSNKEIYKALDAIGWEPDSPQKTSQRPPQKRRR